MGNTSPSSPLLEIMNKELEIKNLKWWQFVTRWHLESELKNMRALYIAFGWNTMVDMLFDKNKVL